MTASVDAVVWDIGHVLVQWSIRGLYEKLIPAPTELDWFLEHVVTRAVALPARCRRAFGGPDCRKGRRLP